MGGWPRGEGWPRIGLGGKFVLLVLLILFVILGANTFLVVKEQRRLLEEQLTDKGGLLGRFVAMIAPEAMLSYDYITLDRFVEEIGRQRDLILGAVLDKTGRPMSAYLRDPAEGGGKAAAEGLLRSLPQRAGVMLLEFPVELDGQPLGKVVLALDRERLLGEGEGLLWRQSATLAALVLILSFGLYLVFRRQVLEPVWGLEAAAARAAEGDYRQPVAIRRRDELGSLASCFNRMMEVIRTEQEQLRKLSQAVEQSPAAVIITDKAGVIEYVNPSFTRLTGYELAEALGNNPRILKSGRMELAQYQLMWNVLSNGGTWHGEFLNRKKNGDYYWAESSIAPIRDADGEIAHFLAVQEDIGPRKEYENRLYQQANFDPLTGLPNRQHALDRLGEMIERAHQDRQRVGVLFLDLDNFKSINDTLGHTTGDELLVAVADRLVGVMGEERLVSRLGGDEFLLLLPQVAEIAEAERLAEQAIEAIGQPFEVGGRELFLGASVGITFYPDDGDYPYHLLRNADAAMYEAKERGRNGWSRFTAALNERLQRRLSLESELRLALPREELRLAYQPLWDLAAGRIIGAEALLRWRNRRLGELSPGEFISVAEDTGLILEIGRWVLEEACRQIMRWRREGLPELLVAVNVSSLQFSHGDIADTVRQTLRHSGLPAEALKLEITESLLLTDPQVVVGTLNELRALGVSLAIDDFGTGYSSLSYLRRLPVDMIKIDRSFVEELEHDGDAAVVIGAIIAMAQQLDLRVVAEGVETVGQQEFLRARGVDIVQGYLISRPLPPSQFAERVAAGLAAG